MSAELAPIEEPEVDEFDSEPESVDEERAIHVAGRLAEIAEERAVIERRFAILEAQATEYRFRNLDKLDREERWLLLGLEGFARHEIPLLHRGRSIDLGYGVVSLRSSSSTGVVVTTDIEEFRAWAAENAESAVYNAIYSKVREVFAQKLAEAKPPVKTSAFDLLDAMLAMGKPEAA